jgi:hypothetical protein
LRLQLSCAAALLLLAASARAEGLRVAFAQLDAAPDLTFTAKAVADAMANEASQHPGVTVLGPVEIEEKLGREAARLLATCADDGRCLARRGAELGVDRVVGGWVKRLAERYRLALVVADVSTGKRLATVVRDVPLGARRLRTEATAAVAELVAAPAAAPR